MELGKGEEKAAVVYFKIISRHMHRIEHVKFLICVREVPGSNLDTPTGCPDVFVWRNTFEE
jgi:hypothetical protein